ncbi:hypothetical protein [Kitasatospora sp. NPDC088783]|uniref:hypothetical protein n=1 Tax=Kitasatospora sp. NPDC088783 TaxID=3364077 RepID=UPI0037F79223
MGAGEQVGRPGSGRGAQDGQGLGAAQAGAAAFSDLVALARGRTKTPLPATSLDLTRQHHLVREDGGLDRDVAEVVRACAAGEGYELVLVSRLSGR